MSVLHVFDMDGTLLRGTTASIEIARATGTLAQLEELESAFVLGTLDTRGFAAALHGLWRGLTPETVREVFHRSPWIDGMAEVLTDIKDRNEFSAAYGDSGSDIPLFEHLRHTVAVNATPALESLAAHHFTGGDLYAIYAAAREHLVPG
jgi:phosphoserine phosphatase